MNDPIPIRAKGSAVGHQIRLARKRSGLTQAELADEIRKRATSRPTYKSSTLKQLISRLERGERITNRKHLLNALTEILGPLDAREQVDMKAHFSRPVMVDISRDGTITYRRRGTPPLRSGFPVLSVHTEEEAKCMQICLCEEMPLPDPQSPGNPWFVFVEFAEAIFAGRDFGDLYGPTVLEFAEAYEKLQTRSELLVDPRSREQ